MAELADAADSKSAEGFLMGVRVPLLVPYLPTFFGNPLGRIEELRNGVQASWGRA